MELKGRGIVGDHITQMSRSEGTPHAKDMDAFKHAGLATAIVSRDQVDSRTRAYIQGLQVSQALKGKAFKRHEKRRLESLPRKSVALSRA
jgi:hypothetical protein